MKDQISALIDDEISLQEAEYLYTALKAEGESRECWMTYHLIGDAMRGSPTFKQDLRKRIMQQIDAEPAVLAPRNAKPALEPVKSSRLWSVAASVAAVMFVGMIVLQQQPQQAEDILPMEIAQSLPAEYLQAHQSVVPSSAAYYIQSAAYTERAK
ncbi:MAG: anti-sigma 24 factor [Betaproteobacteria bacterium HGW-Betaproteobacteria-1]|jgi:sigma-E factor negative regulatory protein RseA|nr:MAG: anti-sigma 24 factor [Betaproteobacteria bacterium HGW-Betaproteobacteria-1]